MKLRSCSVYGGVPIGKQLKILQRGVDIIVATPGRLIDHLNKKSIDLSHIDVLVLDEADRMFDMGFIDDVKEIVEQTPKERQTLLFSATMSSQVRALAAGIQKHPQNIQVGKQRNPAETVTQYIYTISQNVKIDFLLHLLKKEEMDSVLVFSRTKHGADNISHQLHRNGVTSVALHSNRTQAQRRYALEGFKNGKYKVLVATDIAARGIDVEGISHVINFDVPTFPEDYIHRIGRTGRAATTGDAITLVAREEQKYISRIEQFIGKRLERKVTPEFEKRNVPDEKEQHFSEQRKRFGEKRNEHFRDRKKRFDEKRRERKDDFSENRGNQFGERKKRFSENRDEQFGERRKRFSENRGEQFSEQRKSFNGFARKKEKSFSESQNFSEQPKKRKVKRKLIRKASDFANKEKEESWKELFSENQ